MHRSTASDDGRRPHEPSAGDSPSGANPVGTATIPCALRAPCRAPGAAQADFIHIHLEPSRCQFLGDAYLPVLPEGNVLDTVVVTRTFNPRLRDGPSLTSAPIGGSFSRCSSAW